MRDLARRLYRLPARGTLPPPDDGSADWFGGVVLAR
jgi:hypothetical protein